MTSTYQLLRGTSGSPPNSARQDLNTQGQSSPTTSDEADVVQFSVPVFVVRGDAGEASLPLMRLGPKKGTCKFKYATKEGSAKAGEQFEHVSDQMSMGPGEDVAVIKVPVVDDPIWNATKEFTVELSEADGCELGFYLKVVRVKVIDPGAFPSDDFQKEAELGEEAINEISPFRLLPPFMCLLWAQKGIPWRTSIMIVIDTLKNLYEYMTLVLSIYMVDRVFNLKSPADTLMIPGNRLCTAYLVALLLIVPILVFFALDHIIVKMDVKGNLRCYLAQSLFRKFMNYNADSTASTPLPDMVGSVIGDASSVTSAYLGVVGMIRLLGQVGMSVFFTLQQNPGAWWVAVLVPTIMLCWAGGRTDTFLKANAETGDEELACTTFINESLTKLPLIATYQQRPQINSLFAAKTEKLRQAKIKEWGVTLTNMFIPKLLGPALVSFYMVIGAGLVLNGDLKLGLYLATIKVFGNICDAFSDLFGLVMDVIATLPALQGITVLLNKKTDVPDWLDCITKRTEITAEKRKQSKGVTDGAYIPKVDRLQIEISNADFHYTDGNNNKIKVWKELLNFTCPQGTLCAVLSKPGGGRKTMLELLAHVHFPTSGTLFVPSHLRLVYVSQQIVILNFSAWENLTFGNKTGNNPYRVEKILDHFNMIGVKQMCEADLQKRKKLFDGHAPEEEGEDAEIEHGVNKMTTLRESEQAEIHMARAFIMNPEVLVIHRPFVHHNTGAAEREIRTALIEQRDNRGLHMPTENVHLRRPRTIFYSCDHPKQFAFADLCWQLPAATTSTENGGCQQYKPDEARARSFSETWTQDSGLQPNSHIDTFQKAPIQTQRGPAPNSVIAKDRQTLDSIQRSGWTASSAREIFYPGPIEIGPKKWEL